MNKPAPPQEIQGSATDRTSPVGANAAAPASRDAASTPTPAALAGCCTPRSEAAEPQPQPGSCCTRLDALEEATTDGTSAGRPRPVYRSCAAAEAKHGMYVPALEAGALRDPLGRLRGPLPGPPGVTELVREAGIEVGSRVLEVAASVGHIAILAAKLVEAKGEAYLAQLDPTLFGPAEEHARRRGMQGAVGIVQASTEHIPCPTGHFDSVISDRTLCCLYSGLETQQRLLNEMARVTRPGGRVVLVEAVPTGTPVPEGLSIPDCILSTTFAEYPEETVAMLREAGLDRISIKRIPNSQMSTDEMCEATGVPPGDEYVEFAVIVAEKRNGRRTTKE